MKSDILRLLAKSVVHVTLLAFGLLIVFGNTDKLLLVVLLTLAADLITGLVDGIAKRISGEKDDDDTKMPPTWKIHNDKK
jgi:hypothetical protein